MIKIQAIKPGPKPKKEGGGTDHRRGVIPEKRGLKPYRYKPGN